MSVRIKRYGGNGIEQPEWVEKTFEQREVTVDGISYHFGMNETKNFLDDGVGAKIAANAPAGSNIVRDTIPFGTSES